MKSVRNLNGGPEDRPTPDVTDIDAAPRTVFRDRESVPSTYHHTLLRSKAYFQISYTAWDTRERFAQCNSTGAMFQSLAS
jgi:hypothetical protein